MRLALVLLGLVVLTVPALAADIAKLDDVVVEGVYTEYQNQVDAQNPGAALVASVIAGTFTDLGPAYVTALGAAGEAPVDLIYDPAGVWPALGGYSSVVVSLSDLWWSGYWFASDESVLASYIDGGGCCLLVGQDYLYQRGYYTGFPMTHLGLGSVYEDANFGDTGMMDYFGTAGGPIDGHVGSMFPCFSANPWFTDDVLPAVQGLVTWMSPMWGPAEGGCVDGAAGLSAVEFACDTQAQLNAVAGLLIQNLCGGGPPNATQDATWGQVKGLFR